ncbi:hypothetical protein PG990_014400 [Apiospora arundinis]
MSRTSLELNNCHATNTAPWLFSDPYAYQYADIPNHIRQISSTARQAPRSTTKDGQQLSVTTAVEAGSVPIFEMEGCTPTTPRVNVVGVENAEVASGLRFELEDSSSRDGSDLANGLARLTITPSVAAQSSLSSPPHTWLPADWRRQRYQEPVYTGDPQRLGGTPQTQHRHPRSRRRRRLPAGLVGCNNLPSGTSLLPASPTASATQRPAAAPPSPQEAELFGLLVFVGLDIALCDADDSYIAGVGLGLDSAQYQGGPQAGAGFGADNGSRGAAPGVAGFAGLCQVLR